MTPAPPPPAGDVLGQQRTDRYAGGHADTAEHLRTHQSADDARLDVGVRRGGRHQASSAPITITRITSTANPSAPNMQPLPFAFCGSWPMLPVVNWCNGPR